MTRRTLPALLLAAAGGKAAPSKTQAAALDAIQKTDLEFCQVTRERGLDGWMTYFSDEAIAFPPGQPMITGRDKLRAHYGKMFATPELTIDWKPVKADMAASGDLGYTIGVAEFRSRGKDGQIEKRTGKYLTVWKKQADGKWRIAIDLGN